MSVKGGDKLAKVLAQIGNTAKGSVNAGFLSGSQYEDGTPVAAAAFWAEYGHQGPFPAPPRPFMRPSVDEDSPKWVSTLGRAIKHYDYDATAALRATGEVMVESIREHIREVEAPPLSDTTLRLREKFSINQRSEINATQVRIAQKEAAEGKPLASGTGAKPLNWSGKMISSVDFEVNE